MNGNQYARMLDKSSEPSTGAIIGHMGHDAYARLENLEALLHDRYTLTRELRFPYGNSYGWGYNYSHGKKHLLDAFFETGAFTCTFQLGDPAVDAIEESLKSLLPKTREIWEHRYPCGKRGGWIHYRVLDTNELDDVLTLLAFRAKPPKRD